MSRLEFHYDEKHIILPLAPSTCFQIDTFERYSGTFSVHCRQIHRIQNTQCGRKLGQLIIQMWRDNRRARARPSNIICTEISTSDRRTWQPKGPHNVTQQDLTNE